jgi:hypothetical protein
VRGIAFMCPLTVYHQNNCFSEKLNTGYNFGQLLKSLEDSLTYLAIDKSIIEIILENEKEISKKYKENGKNIAINPFKKFMVNPLNFISHEFPITSLDSKDGLIASVDTFGKCKLSSIHNKNSVAFEELEDSYYPEFGWSGISIIDSHNFVSVNRYRRSLIFYADQNVSRFISLAHCPSSVCTLDFEQSSNTLTAVTEFNQVSIWDHRLSEKEGHVSQLMPGNKELFTSAGNRQALAVAGKDRNVYIYDPRKWAVRSVWKSALKHEILRVFLSEARNGFCYAFGKIDGEFACTSLSREDSNTSQSKTFDNFRAESRWIGASKVLLEYWLMAGAIAREDCSWASM